MPMLSSTAWILHDLGLATSIGGTIFGRTALEPALREVTAAQERDRASDVAWRRFSWVNLAAHGAMAVSWMVGRSMLTGEEVSRTARGLVRTKDALVAASVASGVASVVLGRALGRRASRGLGPERARETDGSADREARRTRALERAVGALGIVNLAANTGVAAVTTVLAMEGSQSLRFTGQSRRLP